jgi:hypothetical protein
LRAVGLAQVRRFQHYHWVRNRAVWSSRGASRLLLGLLVETLASDGPRALSIDETIEWSRRRSPRPASPAILCAPAAVMRVKLNGLR